MEGNDNGFLEVRPSPYNVVLEDDTYKGEIKIGLKFFPNVRNSNLLFVSVMMLLQSFRTRSKSMTTIFLQKATYTDRGIHVKEEPESRQSICRTIMNLVRIPWGRFLFFYNRNCEDKQKQV